MKSNAEIADVLDQLADLLEFQGAQSFRIRAYRSASRVIRQHPQAVAVMVQEDPRSLQSLDGVGKSVAEKCRELLATGRLQQLDQLLEEVPESVLSLLRIPGLGPRKAATLYQQLGIATLDALQAACQAQQVRRLKGFGPKTEELILRGIAIADAAGRRLYWSAADQLVSELRKWFEHCPGTERLEFAGSYRRGRETVGDLDILVAAADSAAVMDHLGNWSRTEAVLARGNTKMSIRIDHGFQIDLRVVPQQSFGAAWQYFTGSKEHNVKLRSRAQKLGLKINEYGVFPESASADGAAPDGRSLAGVTEADVYAAVNLAWIPPELREGRREIEWAQDAAIPSLVDVDDLIGDLHMHTDDTDGMAGLEEMVAAACERGLQYIAITDHSQRVSMARGLNAERLRAQWKRIDDLNASGRFPIRVLKGIECDILERGGLDLPDDVLAEADWVVASIHYGQRQPRDQITGRLLDALRHPAVSVIAHPTGRLINRREPYDVDLDRVLDAAAEFGKLMELNANPARLDLDDIHCAAAQHRGVPIVISSDAHNPAGLDVLRYGVMQARRGGLAAGDIANTRPWPEVQALIGRG